eukprot:39276-Pleurochrysis_carterae.AAC.2
MLLSLCVTIRKGGGEVGTGSCVYACAHECELPVRALRCAGAGAVDDLFEYESRRQVRSLAHVVVDRGMQISSNKRGRLRSELLLGTSAGCWYVIGREAQNAVSILTSYARFVGRASQTEVQIIRKQ